MRALAAKKTEKMVLFALFAEHGTAVRSVCVKSYFGKSKVGISLFYHLSRLTESGIVKYNRDFKKALKR